MFQDTAYTKPDMWRQGTLLSLLEIPYMGTGCTECSSLKLLLPIQMVIAFLNTMLCGIKART